MKLHSHLATLLLLIPQSTALTWATIGDSWAAGAAIKSSKRYDDTPCRRSIDAWGLQLQSDETWTTEPQNYTFVPCGESQLGDLTGQLNDVGNEKELDLLTMISGGNNCNVGAVVEACVFLGKSIGGWRNCEKALGDAAEYIEDGFEADFRTAIKSAVESQAISKSSGFRLYVLGYAAFFAVAESGEGDWCDDVEFGLSGVKLEIWKRERMNGLIRRVNSLIEKVVGEFEEEGVRYVDIDRVFEGHRFCESRHAKQEQWWSADVWFWNLYDPDKDPDYEGWNKPGKETFIDERYEVKAGKEWLRMRSEQSQVPLQDVETDDLWTARIFHPKLRAHTAIKNALIAIFQADDLPGIKPAPSPPKRQPYSHGTAILKVVEYWDCLDDLDNLSVETWLLDSTSKLIGRMNRTQAGVHAPVGMGSKFEETIVITPSHEGAQATVRFGFGQLKLGSDDAFDEERPEKPWCFQEEWNAPACWRGEKVVEREIQCHFPAARLQTAEEYVRGDREEEGFAICDELLKYPDLGRANKAGAHFLLSISSEDGVWHAQKAVELYEGMHEEEPEDEATTEFLKRAKELLKVVLNEENTGSDLTQTTNIDRDDLVKGKVSSPNTAEKPANSVLPDRQREGVTGEDEDDVKE